MKTLQDFYEEGAKKTKTREGILQAAYDLFADHGMEAVTMKEVADACEITVRNLYRYYPSKEYLVVDTAYYAFYTNELFEYNQFESHLTGIETLEWMLKSLYEKEKSDDVGLKVMSFIMYFDLYLTKMNEDHPAYQKYINTYRDEINQLGYGEMRKVLENGIADGSISIELKDVDFYIVFILQSLISIVMRTIVKESENPTINGSLVEKQIEMMIKHIGV